MDNNTLVELGFLESPLLLAIVGGIAIPYINRKFQQSEDRHAKIAEHNALNLKRVARTEILALRADEDFVGEHFDDITKMYDQYSDKDGSIKGNAYMTTWYASYCEKVRQARGGVI